MGAEYWELSIGKGLAVGIAVYDASNMPRLLFLLPVLLPASIRTMLLLGHYCGETRTGGTAAHLCVS